LIKSSSSLKINNLFIIGSVQSTALNVCMLFLW